MGNVFFFLPQTYILSFSKGEKIYIIFICAHVCIYGWFGVMKAYIEAFATT